MAGKANILKQFFIQIGLIGAKTAIKDLLKVDKQTEKTGKTAEKAIPKVNELGAGLKKAGKEAEKASSKLAMFGKGLLLPIKGAIGLVKLLARGLKGIASSMLRVVEIAAGIQLSNISSIIGRGIRGFVTSSFDLAEEEETTRETLRQSFRVQGKGGFADSFLKTIDRLGNKFGVSIVNLAKAFQGTLIPVKKLARVAEVVAKFGIIRPDKDPGIIARQIGQLLAAGSLEETLKDLAPQLRTLKEDERISRGLEVLEKQLENVTAADNKTFSFRQRQLQLRFNELKRTFGRPILKVLGEIFGELLDNNVASNLTDSGNAVAQVIRTFWNALGGTKLGPIITQIDKFLAIGIKWFGIAAKDIFDFLTGAPSALQKIFLPDMTPEEAKGLKGIWELIKVVFKSISDKVVEITGGLVNLEATLEAVVGFTGKAIEFFSDVIAGLEKIRIQIRDWSPFGGNDDAELPKKDPGKRKGLLFGGERPVNFIEKMSPDELKLFKDFDKGGKNPVDATNDTIEMNKRFNALPKDERDFINRSKRSKFDPVPDNGDQGTPDPNDQGAINFNTDIRITTQQPANIVRNQLANQMALIGNQGRLA